MSDFSLTIFNLSCISIAIQQEIVIDRTNAIFVNGVKVIFEYLVWSLFLGS